MNIKVEGIENVLASIEELADTSKLSSAIGKGCAVVERAAKEKVPKGTGALRRSITSKVESGSSEVKGIVYTPLEYAPYVEFGTGLFAESKGRKDVPWSYKDDEGNWYSSSGQKPSPYLRPALNENKTKVVNTIKEALAK